MPIHDQSYRHYAGTRAKPGGAWMVIASTGIRAMMTKRLFLVLLLASWGQLFVQSVRVYLASQYPQFSLLSVETETYRTFLEYQNFFVFVITVWVGAGLIAADRRSNALQLYLSKPLMRAEYVIGKMAILTTFLLLVTWVPAMLLLIVQIVFKGSFEFIRANLFLIPAITLGSLVQVLLASFTMLALSSLSKSARFVAILYAGVLFFSKAMFGALMLITGGTRIAWVSFSDNVTQVVDVIFRLKPRYEVPWSVSLLVIVALMVISASVLERRVRGVEVVT